MAGHAKNMTVTLIMPTITVSCVGSGHRPDKPDSVTIYLKQKSEMFADVYKQKRPDSL